MSVRRQIVAALSEDSLGGIAALADVTHAEQLADALVAESAAATLHQAADEIDQAQQRLLVKKTVVNILRRRANQAGEKATTSAATATPDTLANWLYLRFDKSSAPWEDVDLVDRTYWEHEAQVVRRAVARGGFRTADPQAGAR